MCILDRIPQDFNANLKMCFITCCEYTRQTGLVISCVDCFKNSNYQNQGSQIFSFLARSTNCILQPPEMPSDRQNFSHLAKKKLTKKFCLSFGVSGGCYAQFLPRVQPRPCHESEKEQKSRMILANLQILSNSGDGGRQTETESCFLGKVNLSQ
jgi:hypothetical protein